jgi:hypothetical protein
MTTVLTAMPTYFLTVFALKKWVIKRLDKIRRSFLWKGSTDARGGHCLVRWSKVRRPKELGGLGVLDFDLFSRALRLRWLWFQWKDPDRPWVGTELPCNEDDKQLFWASTVVGVGNGLTARFWESAWLDGKAPRDLAPNMYRLAWRKNQTVRGDLQNQNGTRGIWRMSTTVEMAEFVSLWTLLQDVQLTQDSDQITWHWTTSGAYTSKSAYRVQFLGSFNTFDSKAIWQAKVEGKHNFFGWLLIQCKILTTDKLAVRNWPCNPLCLLCDQVQETAEHLCSHCVFVQELWLLVSEWTRSQVKMPRPGHSLQDWWHSSFTRLCKKDK